MTPSASKVSSRLALLRLNFRATYERESAYVWQNWGSLFSTLAYTTVAMLFVTVVYSNVRQVAGYSQDEMLFLLLVGQVNFYMVFNWSFDNLEQLIVDVNRGDLDLALTKPLPALFYLCTRKASLVQLLRDSLPPIVLISLSIHWVNIHAALAHVAAGIVVFACGVLAMHTLQFLLAVPVFWLGESTAIFSLVWAIDGEDIPYEGYPRGLRIALTYFVPILVSGSLCASVILGKAPALPFALGALATATGCLALRAWAWQKALRAYTSASS